MTLLPQDTDVLVIGAGPGGLAVGAELRRRDVQALLVDRAPAIASTWRQAYDRVRLNTARSLSHLPGRRIPAAAGRWPARDDYLAYLERYAADNALDVRLGVEALRIDRDGERWAVETSAGVIHAQQVVVATGYSAEPLIPDWPGSDTFGGTLTHSSGYRNARPFRGRRVLVAGAGNSGAEIAVDLAEGGAASVAIAIRTPPHVVRREVMGMPNQYLGIALRRLPAPIADAIAAAGARLSVGDLTRYGLPRPRDGVVTRHRRDGAIPVVDAGFIDALVAGRIEVVAPVERLTASGVVLADGSERSFDAIVAATGYRTGLSRLAGHLGVVDERGVPVVHGTATAQGAPGLRFIGFSNPLSGNLRELRLDARRVARALAGELRAERTAPAGAARCCVPRAA